MVAAHLVLAIYIIGIGGADGDGYLVKPVEHSVCLDSHMLNRLHSVLYNSLLYLEILQSSN